jgi:hypothetical protein
MEGQFGFEIRFSRLGVKRGRVTDLGILPGQAFSKRSARQPLSAAMESWWDGAARPTTLSSVGVLRRAPQLKAG